MDSMDSARSMQWSLASAPMIWETQRKFKEKYALPFELIADSDKRVVKAYDVSGMFGFAKRRTFIIDPKGIIRHIIEDVETSTHAEQVRKILATLRAEK